MPTAVRVLETVALIAIDNRVLSRAVEIEPVRVRSLDAIHLATALSLGLDLAAFITYDGIQAKAARALGLPVLSPGAS
jgi:hypothetical protein